MRPLLLTVPLLAGCLSTEDYSAFGGAGETGPLLGLGETSPSAVPHTSEELTHRSATFADANSLVLPDDAAAWVGMAAMACEIELASGSIALDYDPAPFHEETVTDANDDVVVTTSRNRLHIVARDEPWSWETYVVRDVVDGRASDEADDGVVILTSNDDGCRVGFGLDDDGPVRVDDAACLDRAAFAVDPRGPAAYTPGDAGVQRITPSGRDTLPVHGDLLTWDRQAAALYVASEGEGEVTAWRADGTRKWSVTLEHPVRGLSHLGDAALAVALVDVGEGSEVWFLDAATGDARKALSVDTRVDGIAGSADGQTLGVISAHQLDFFTR
jgi:hypothetical protein